MRGGYWPEFRGSASGSVATHSVSGSGGRAVIFPAPGEEAALQEFEDEIGSVAPAASRAMTLSRFRGVEEEEAACTAFLPRVIERLRERR